MLLDVVDSILILLGAFFMLVAAIGIIRMPDLLIRMHAATKAGTLGAALLLIGVAIHFGETSVTLRAVSIVVFLFLTAPIAAHMIGRAAYCEGEVKLWDRTVVDELKGRYNALTHEPESQTVQPITPKLGKPAKTNGDDDTDLDSVLIHI